MVFCYIGAKLIALLEPEKTEYAANMLCKVDSTFSGVEIKVSFIESQKKELLKSISIELYNLILGKFLFKIYRHVQMFTRLWRKGILVRAEKVLLNLTEKSVKKYSSMHQNSAILHPTLIITVLRRPIMILKNSQK